jgi:hypothetical protein
VKPRIKSVTKSTPVTSAKKANPAEKPEGTVRGV